MENRNNASTPHILVIRLSAMGDAAMTVPVLLAFQKAYPHIKLSVLTKPFLAPIFEQIPNITVHKAAVKNQHKGAIGLWKLYRSLKKEDITHVADLHNVLRSSILKVFFKVSGVPVIQLNKGRAEKKALTAAQNKVFKPLTPMYLRYAEVFKSLGYAIEMQTENTLQKPANVLAIQKRLGLANKPCIGIAPFATFVGKRYPLQHMKTVLQELNATNKYELLLFGGGTEEKDILEEWEQEFKNVTSVVGKITFSEELKLIATLSVMLSMDSGNGHLAAMYGVPVVSLWGVTHPYAGFYPFGQPISNALLADREAYPLIPTSVYGNKMPAGYENVMDTIHPKDVVNKINELLVKEI